ncbi:MAG: cell division FtsA domain-containing protein [Lachnospiraceae bacterium]|nr:rod shape-determining protein [Lachnospiraceae bacterium]MDY3222931.1 cell division FtsA domain-containing protein [Lachnospiraceae bacterium]
MEKSKNYGGQLVFGLDIGTRSIVGTVGYKDGERFIVVAQKVKEHDTRAMLDGQIHDIERVGETIAHVKEALEQEIGRRLVEVCIAAAGRVLETVTSHADIEYEEEHLVTKEDIYTLDSIAVEKAYELFLKENENGQKFYCVGNSVICYYLNDFHISNLENHKARKIGVDLIATFLPDEVVDGLNKAVELAGLQVANMTLEPIAAIQVAIPERYRLLNIALVDVGAGTSDISITRDGSIIAYGMIPKAGDCLTEQIALHCLTDFQAAEAIKKDAGRSDVIGFEDIMGLRQTIETSEINQLLEPVLEEMTTQVADQIRELNGGKPVSAVFVVGGGGKVNGYTQKLADKLGIQPERVAIRGAEVMQKIEFSDPAIEKDSLLVTPIGICLNFYEQDNNFVFVSFNGQKVKLYDNKHLTVTDAAIQAKFPNDGFFPKRGKELEFTVDGKKRIVRGEAGEGAVITLNGKAANIHSAIKKDDIIEVEESTAGQPARMEIRELPEFRSTLLLEINGRQMVLPKFASVNGVLQSEYYEIQDKDTIEFLNYYTVEQILTFMDLSIQEARSYYVNNAVADLGTRVYENFSVRIEEQAIAAREESPTETRVEEPGQEEGIKRQENSLKAPQSRQLVVVVNQSPVVLRGKEKYIFVDVFDYISFDLSKPQGAIVTTLNGKPAQFMEELHDGDILEIYWRTI